MAKEGLASVFSKWVQAGGLVSTRLAYVSINGTSSNSLVVLQADIFNMRRQFAKDQADHWKVILLTASSLLICCSTLHGREPFGAEDAGAEDNSPSIPEPMVFDLVRGLGAQRGELEVNVLAEFPLGNSGSSKRSDFDPFGLAPASADRNGIEWAPEIEYALCDGFAIEFELPFENSTLEAYKFAAQWTFGTAWENRLIDGAQVIIEPDIRFETWDLTLLYLVGVEFDQYWSALAMIGARPEIVEGEGAEHIDGILNATVFRDLDLWTTLGLETNFTFGERDRTTFLLIPQVDREITNNIEVQLGAGVGFAEHETDWLAALRLIYSK